MSEVNSVLLSAIRYGKIERVREILYTYGVSYSKDWSDGYVLLCVALEYKKPAIVMLLLDMGCKVNKNNFKPANTPLHYAAINDDLEIVKELVAKGTYIDVINTRQMSPLDFAIANVNIDIVQFLLQSGACPQIKNNYRGPLHDAVKKSLRIVELLLDYNANINCVCNNELRYQCVTPLHIATIFNKVETVKLLLNRGATVDCRAKNNITPLHMAVENGYLTIVKLLIDHGASINFAGDLETYTPLHFAINKGNSQLVSLLLQHGANVNIKDKTDNTVVYLAVQKGNLSIVEQILNFHPEINDGNNRNILNVAIYGNNTQYQAIIELLLNYGFSLNIEEENNYNLLFAAVAKGYLNVVKILLDHCTDINILHDPETPKASYNLSSQKAHTLLHCATKKKHESVAELLINYGADVNIKDQAGYPPIFYAIDTSDIKITKLLLNNGADIHGIQCKTQLLNIAVKKEYKEIVEILLQHGADVNAVDKHGRTALHFTVSGEDDNNFIRFFYDYDDSEDSDVKTEIVKLLLKHGAHVDAKANNGIMTLHAAVQRGHVKVVDALLEHNANVNSRTTKGTTPLHVGVRKGNKAIITKLLDKGADINETLENRGTVLHIATQNGHKEIVKILLNYGAQVDSKMERNVRPLHIAAKKGHLDIVKILLDHGADVNSTNEYGATALHITSNEGHEKIVACLIDHGCDINIFTKKNYTPLDFARASINLLNGRAWATEIYNEYYGVSYHDLQHRSHSCEEILKILKKQIIRLKTANLYVNKRNLLLLDESMTEELKEFQKSCEKEIELMKYEKINNDSISFYDVLTKSEFGIYTKNNDVKQTLQSDAYKLKFPIYERIVFFNFIKGTERKELLEESLDFFYCLFEISEILPYNCAENTFKFISNKDLRYFVDVCKILKISNINNTNSSTNTMDTS